VLSEGVGGSVVHALERDSIVRPEVEERRRMKAFEGRSKEVANETHGSSTGFGSADSFCPKAAASTTTYKCVVHTDNPGEIKRLYNERAIYGSV
jgi:hypothetical protein